MIQTKTPQNYVQGTTVKTGIVYAVVKNVMFQLLDDNMVCYLEMGVIQNVFDPNTESEEQVYVSLGVDTLTFTDVQMKALIDATGTYFNSNQSNLLVADMNVYSDTIILNDIAVNPDKYFGIELANWEVSPNP